MSAENLQKKIKYVFSDKKFLDEALTHRSFLNENPSRGAKSNERLEFLGDAVLELVVTEELFNRFPDFQEGKMTSVRAALVNYLTLSEVAAGIELGENLKMSKGEAKDTGRARDVILANAMEALIGAVYLDGGYKAAKKFILSFVLSRLEDVLKKGLYLDAKSTLQEKVQEKNKLTPTYKVISATGPDHLKTFQVGVYFGDKLVAEGSGHSKQEAEVAAARKALQIISEER